MSDTSNLQEELREIFKLAKGIIFEDGMYNAWTLAIHDFFEQYGVWGYIALDEFLKQVPDNRIERDEYGESLVELGRISRRKDEPETEALRIDIILPYLKHWSYILRERSLTALGVIDNPVVLPLVYESIRCETNPDMRGWGWRSAYELELTKYNLPGNFAFTNIYRAYQHIKAIFDGNEELIEGINGMLIQYGQQGCLRHQKLYSLPTHLA